MSVCQSRGLVFPQKTCQIVAAAETGTHDPADHGNAFLVASKVDAAGHAVLLRIPLR